MKTSPLLLSSLMATNGLSNAKPFGVTSSKIIVASKQASTLSVSVFGLRGGDLGSLTADASAKALVGLQLVDGYLMWQATEGMMKAWSTDSMKGVADDATAKQKFFFQCTGFNIFSTAMAGAFLLNGASAGTAIGLLSLMFALQNSCLLIDDVAGNLGFDPKGIYVNLLLYSATAFGNLMSLGWATLANNMGGAWFVLNSVLALTGKFKEVYKLDNDDSALSTLAMNNVIWSMLSSCACYIALLKVSDVNKVIAYSQIPFTLLCIHGAFFGKAAKKLAPDGGRYSFAFIMTTLVLAMLL